MLRGAVTMMLGGLIVLLCGPTGAVARAPERAFARTSFWNAPLPRPAGHGAPSQGAATALRAEVEREMRARSGPWINTSEYSVPIYTAGPRAPRVRVQLDGWSPALQRDFEAVPLPAGAAPAAGTDAQLAVYQPSTDTMWEFWLARRAADGWHARWGGRMSRVSSSAGYFADPYGATATGLPLMGGLITAAELRRGQIRHALALGIPNTAAGTFRWPAQRGDGTTTGPGAVPEGARFRIDPSLDLTRLGLSRVGLAMARAAQRYGIVVRDTAGCAVFYAEDPRALAADPYPTLFGGAYPSELLRGFPWYALEAVAPPRR